MNVEIRVELAFGDDPTTDPAGWDWVDVSADVHDQDITIRRGRSDESSGPEASTATVELDNPHGDYTPTDRRSVYWPNVRRGTPVRISARKAGDGWSVRFVGQVSEWQPSWPYGDISDHDNPDDRPGEARVTVVCNGILRRLAQNRDLAGSALARANRGAVWYWPLETSGAGTSNTMSIPRNGSFGEAAELPSSAGALILATPPASGYDGPAISAEAQMSLAITGGPYPDGTSPAWVWVMMRPSGPGSWSSRTSMLTIATAGYLWTVSMSATQLRVSAMNTFDASVTNYDLNIARDVTGEWVRFAVGPSTLGACDIGLFAVGTTQNLLSSSSVAAPNWVRPTSVSLHPPADPNRTQEFAHLLVGAGAPVGWDVDAEAGWVGEAAVDRVERLCGEESVAVVVEGDTVTPMGAQPDTSLVDALAESAASEDGILAERVDRPGLRFVARGALYNRPADLTLDASENEISEPFAPTFDDQRLRNDITVTAADTARRATDPDSIDAEGLYDTDESLSLAEPAQALTHAGWLLHRGTWPAMRYPTVAASLDTAPDGWLDLLEGHRVQIVGLPPQHPTAAVDVTVEGITETITPVSWVFEAACSPAGVWDVAVLDDDPDDPDLELARLTSGGSTLAADIDETDTVLSVDGPLWTVDDDLFPFVVDIDGEPFTVVDISGASPQTFTVVRTLEAPRPHLTGAELVARFPVAL